jgi:hypothetical protein
MMEKDKNKIDELFKEGLSDTNFDFDESHWQDIASRLDNERRSKRRKIVVLMTWAATLAAVLTVFFIWNSATESAAESRPPSISFLFGEMEGKGERVR